MSIGEFIGGGGRIRTHGTLTSTAVFKTYQTNMPDVTKTYQYHTVSPVFTGRPLPAITKSYQLKWDENGRIS